MKPFVRKLMWLVQWRRREAELREELEFHLEEEAEERREQGLTDEQAAWAAQRDLGNVALVQENVRGVWIWRFWERLLQDLRYALRMMRKNPAFSLLATLSLALGIGANTAIYSFMDALLLRSLPVPDPGSLVAVKWHSKPEVPASPLGSPKGHGSGQAKMSSVIHGVSGESYDDSVLGLTSGIFPYSAFELLQKHNLESPLLSTLFAYYPAKNLHVMIKGQAEISQGEYVSGDYFSCLAIASAAGRLISPEDDRPGAPVVAVASFAFSQAHFGGPANAAGQTILINNVPVEIVGVTSPEFFGVDPAASPEFYIPLRVAVAVEAAKPFGIKSARYLDQNTYWIEMMGRLLPGISREKAQAAMAALFGEWVKSTAANDQERANLPVLILQDGGGGRDRLRRRFSEPLYILMTLVGLILAIACANIANLLLARATARRNEMALRLSIGASRLRILRQLLTESVLLASLGAMLGIMVALWSIRFLTLLLANGQPNFTLHAELNWRVLGVTAALALLTGVLFGLAPGLQSATVDVLPALKEIRPTEKRSRGPLSLGQVLVVAQIALSLLLLVAAALFERTLSNLQSVEIGFNREKVLLFTLNAQQAGHKTPEIVSFYADLQKRLSVLPGVRSVSLANTTILGNGTWGWTVTVNGARVDGTRFLTVGPGFSTTMEIPMLLGREIGASDQANSAPVAMVNERFARLHFGNENAVGRHIGFGQDATKPLDMEIVGVTKDIRYGQLTNDIFPIVYVPYNQGSWPVDEMTYAVRTYGNPLAQVNATREIVRRADPRVPVTDVRTQAAQIDQSINQEIIFARLCTLFALLALLIASVGLYGTLSYNVVRRTGEIGIRMALGAQRGAVVWMVLRQVFILAMVGLAISVPVALAAAKFVASFLYGMKPNDPLSLTLAVAVLLGAALVAGYLPARKASRIDPMTALRHE